MPAAAVSAVGMAYSAYAANKASKEARARQGRAESQMGNAFGLYGDQRDRALGLIGNSDQTMSNLLNKDFTSNPMFFASDKAEFEQEQAAARRGLAGQLGRQGLAGSGLGSAAVAGLGYRGAAEVGNIRDRNQRLWMDKQGEFSNRMNGIATQSTAGAAGVLQTSAGMNNQWANQADQAAQQGWANAAQGFGGMVSGLSSYYAGKNGPSSYNIAEEQGPQMSADDVNAAPSQARTAPSLSLPGQYNGSVGSMLEVPQSASIKPSIPYTPWSTTPAGLSR